MTDPAAIYTPEYYARLKAIEANHWWSLGMLDLMDEVLRDRVPEPRDTLFLDVGCGSGIGLAWAASRLAEARRIGLDVSRHALDHCDGLGARLLRGTCAALPFQEGCADLAICLDVLQHLESDAATLRDIERALKPGALLFLRTNARMWSAPPPGSNLYTAPRLAGALRGVGFAILHCSPANSIGSLAAELAAWRRPERSHHHGDESPASGGGYGGGLRLVPEDVTSRASRFKRGLLRAEGRWIRRGLRLPFGHSLVALAQKALR